MAYSEKTIKKKNIFGYFRQSTAKIFQIIQKLNISGYKAKPKLLLHICCIGCGAYISQILSEEYDVYLYFYNPNIFPKKEYEKRLEDINRVAKELNFEVILADYDHEKWLEKVKGLEKEPEKGARCIVCYEDRLRETVEAAKLKKFDYFTTTLTVSPHKLAKEIIQIGQKLEEEFGIKFLARDFKKQDGFKKAAEFSKKLNLYRQNYCGCEFSMRNIVCN